MPQPLNSSSSTFIPPQPIPAGAQDFSRRVQGLFDGRAKDEATVTQALTGMDAMLDAIAAGLYTLASMLVGEGEDGIRLVETAVATTDVVPCGDVARGRQSIRKALVSAALELMVKRNPGCLAAPEGVQAATGCIDDDDLEAAGVSKGDLERMMAGPDRARVRTWLEKLPTALGTVFVLRAVAGFPAAETARLLAAHGGPTAAAWNADAVRTAFRMGLCSLASQLLLSSAKAGA